MSDKNPQTDVEARLIQIKNEIDWLLAGGTARSEDGHTAGRLDEINGVVFGLNGRETDVRITQEPGRPPASVVMLAYYIEGMSNTLGEKPSKTAARAIKLMEKMKDEGSYTESHSLEVGESDE